MLAFQRELGFAVVEGAARHLHTLPAFGLVAGLAAGHKRPVMRVLVAAAAGLKVYSFVLDDFASAWVGLWHFAHSTFSCFPVSGKCVIE